MQRYFLELSYKGTNYSGFQSQHNANTVQAEMEKAMKVLLKKEVRLTGSSRTDAGVHALQNFFHFDAEGELAASFVYNLNAILPGDISVREVRPVKADAHCRFDAVSREYTYYIYRTKNPFLEERALFYPYRLDMELMNEAAEELKRHEDFTSFSKKRTQVKTFRCRIEHSLWREKNGMLMYEVKANRFLRGMVRALTATMLRVGRGKIGVEEFVSIIESKENRLTDFSVPAHGLFLKRVNFFSPHRTHRTQPVLE